ncbi:hypothetical protein Taro_037361 [Colocasia esculenta]|uniref:Ribosomal RNA-processing protein 7 C-terminal domain-containing protein n=1 Tax=Colocasia esculenta TaxID=4460 RepID=A0A843WAX4_COLES|nr:hypothetical protein [Colocasia esculenta]
MNQPIAVANTEAEQLYLYPPHFPHKYRLPRRLRTPPRQHPRRPAVSPPRKRLVDSVITAFVGLSLGDPGASSSSRQSLSPTTASGTNPRSSTEWVLDYRRGRLGLDMVQQRLDEFMTAYEAEQEQARKEREAQGAEEGWTVVVHHKGRKKTTDSESGIAVGSVPQAAVEDKMAKKKQKELALDFYRFQKREAQRNEVMMLQSKFEQDKKRLQQLRAARKFRPY